jgi:hypothetical protein
MEGTTMAEKTTDVQKMVVLMQALILLRAGRSN